MFVCIYCVFFFFKQKTAYEMRISDWSSDVCSSDLDGERIVGTPEQDVDRTTADGKASSVQFIHFPFTDAQVAKFKQVGTRVVLGFAHPQYGHMTILPEDVRNALAQDFA